VDEERFLKACRMRDEGRFLEAYQEFVTIATTTQDQIERGGILMNAAIALSASGQYEEAWKQLSAARSIGLGSDVSGSPATTDKDEHRIRLEVELDFEEADLFWAEGKGQDALARFNRFLSKHSTTLRKPDFRNSYEAARARKAFVLADLGRWCDALPLLEEAQSFAVLKEGIAFYLGHCYLAAGRYERAEDKLIQALSLGLPKSLEYRAHCELGITWYNLGDYSKAKQELQKGAREADSKYLSDSEIWKWLEAVSRRMGLNDEAEEYARRARPS
jgi:tetratricopeptide (TPR) repeat protein